MLFCYTLRHPCHWITTNKQINEIPDVVINTPEIADNYLLARQLIPHMWTQKAVLPSWFPVPILKSYIVSGIFERSFKIGTFLPKSSSLDVGYQSFGMRCYLTDRLILIDEHCQKEKFCDKWFLHTGILLFSFSLSVSFQFFFATFTLRQVFTWIYGNLKFCEDIDKSLSLFTAAELFLPCNKNIRDNHPRDKPGCGLATWLKMKTEVERMYVASTPRAAK